MSNAPKQNTDPSQPMIYQIRLECHLDDQWANRFEGMTIKLEENGNTLLTGPVVDQAALFGLLKKIRDMGMPLISVNRVESQSKITIAEKGELKMNANPTKKLDTKDLLSTLWLLVYLNILTADILSLNIPGSDELLKATSVSTGTPIPQLMLFGAITNELSIVMILLSRVLKYGVNRWVNIVMSIVTITYVWALGSPYPHYVFIATVETICLLLIIWNVWKWSGSEA